MAIFVIHKNRYRAQQICCSTGHFGPKPVAGESAEQKFARSEPISGQIRIQIQTLSRAPGDHFCAGRALLLSGHSKGRLIAIFNGLPMFPMSSHTLLSSPLTSLSCQRVSRKRLAQLDDLSAEFNPIALEDSIQSAPEGSCPGWMLLKHLQHSEPKTTSSPRALGTFEDRQSRRGQTGNRVKKLMSLARPVIAQQTAQ